ncbi:MAG: putative breaking-rejoining enzyme catalytic core [Moraxellaceae bacterium]|jgi:hypothetical protein|nr:putative breaking-rejoining enzyme catalytic core [Moraxellaceae bacterium]
MSRPLTTPFNQLSAGIRLAEYLLGHPELRNLQGIVQDILDLASRIADREGLPHLRQAISLAHDVQQQVNWEQLPEGLRGYPRIHRNDRSHPISPFYGDGLSDYPVWPILLTQHDDPELNARYRAFMAEAVDHLIAYVNAFSTVSHYREWVGRTINLHPLREYLPTALAVSVTLRYLVHTEYTQELTEFLSEYEKRGLAQSLWFVRDSGKFSAEFQGRIAALERMLAYLDGREPPSRIGGNIYAQKPRSTEAYGCARVAFLNRADDYTDDEDAAIEGIGASLLTISPDDLEDPSPEDGATSTAERRRWTDPAYQIQHVARANLSLPYTRSHLQAYQIAAIDTWMHTPDIQPTRRRLLAGMLLLGRSLRVMLDARFAISSVPRASDVEVELLVDIGCWRIRPELPDVEPGEGPSYLPVEVSLCLPLLPEWREVLLPPDAAELVGQRLTEGLEITERRLLQQLREIEGDLKPSQVTQWLGRTLFLTTHSHNAAALLTPYGAPHLHTLTHYEHPRIEDLVAAYVRVLATLQPLLYPTPGQPPLPIPPPQQDGSARTGTPTASDPGLITQWVNSTYDGLSTMRLETSSDVCSYSNEFVRYAMMLVGANTLARGTTNPDMQLVDRTRRLLVVSDKDRGGRGAMSRLIPLTRDGLRQFDWLAEHRRVLRTMPGMPADIDDMAYPILAWHGDEPGARRSLKIEAATTRDILGENFPGRLNALRKYLHTRLQELGVPGQYLDALSGHWHPGMEPYAQYSALNPRQMREVLLPHLTRLMRELGFRPIRSRLA